MNDGKNSPSTWSHEGLGAPKIGEKIAQLLVVETIQQAFRHEGSASGAGAGDFVFLDQRAFAVEAAENDGIFITLRKEAGEIAAIFGFDDHVFETFADFAAGIHDVHQHVVEIVTLVTGEVGPDLPAFGEKL